jgi:predicted nucleic acid-binding protein
VNLTRGLPRPLSSPYGAWPDKGYSLIDCGSMLALRALGVSEVLTNDHHFTQERFAILFP